MPSGPRLVAFFAIIYYAALRPEEAVNLRKDNITFRRSYGMTLRANGRNLPKTGANYDFAQPQPR